ncbi:MAG: ABC transporter permease [Acidobacteria bacterium]|nr:MAG: ABC transporter permease [Acidobacteriota bacterium]
METKMVISNLLHRPTRTIISILAVAIEVGLVMLTVGMTTGMLSETARRVEGIGADIIVQPPGASFLMGFTPAPMPIKIGDLLEEKVEHVAHVLPVLILMNVGVGVNIVFGINREQFDAVTGGFVFHSGGWFTGPDDIIVDDLYAKAGHLKVGQKLTLFSHSFRITGIVEHGKGARLFIPLQTDEELNQTQDKASIFFVKCTDPGYTDDAISGIRQFLPTYPVRSMAEYTSLYSSNNLPALNTFIEALICIALTIGFLVIFLSMYTTITERTREIGILKSLGASKSYIMSLILREAATICVLGIAAGEVGTLGARRVLQSSFPTLAVRLTPHWMVYAAVLAMGGTVLGAVYPALRAASLDPVDALAYE